MPNGSDLHIVTGAFGFTGRAIARLLLSRGRRVRTLTNHPRPSDPLSKQIESFPLQFDNPSALAESLRGAAALYNTYWVRFERGDLTFARAVANSQALFAAAREAGVPRLVHISITNPSLDSPFPYFRGKAELEETLKTSGLSYAILRPAVLFGQGDILINNIAWLLRRLPVFGIFGRGDYGIQPAYVEDLAALAVEHAAHQDNVVLDAVGPETYTYLELVQLLRRVVGSRARLLYLPPSVGLAAGTLLGRLTGDVLITPDEIGGLMANLLVSSSPPTCPTKLSDWLMEHADEVGKAYASEVKRHY